MNTSYEELDADIEQQLPNDEESKERCENCENCNDSVNNFIKDISKCLKWTLIWILFMFTIFVIVTYFVELIKCRTDGQCRYDEQHDYYLKENHKSNHRKLTGAGRIHYYRRHRKTCDDYEFGCCEIYTDCKYNQTDFTHYNTYTFHGLPKHDENGKNCPRLLDLVKQHNYHYPLDEGLNCEDSKYGCYKIETECDIRIRFMDVEDGLNDDIELYKRNTNLVERVGVEWKPSVMGLMGDYINKYPKKGMDGSGMIFGFLFLALVAMCSGGCNKTY